jgi:hypothetical protein
MKNSIHYRKQKQDTRAFACLLPMCTLSLNFGTIFFLFSLFKVSENDISGSEYAFLLPKKRIKESSRNNSGSAYRISDLFNSISDFECNFSGSENCVKDSECDNKKPEQKQPEKLILHIINMITCVFHTSYRFVHS